MTERGPKKCETFPNIFASALWRRGCSTLLRQSSAKHRRAEESPSWCWTRRCHYTSFLPTEAESALSYAGFVAILPEESNLKQLQHHQEMRPVTGGFKWIWASKWKYSLAKTTPCSSGYSSLYYWLLGVAFLMDVSALPTFAQKAPDLCFNGWIWEMKCQLFLLQSSR